MEGKKFQAKEGKKPGILISEMPNLFVVDHRAETKGRGRHQGGRKRGGRHDVNGVRGG